LSPGSGITHASSQHSRRSTWLTTCNKLATEIVGATAKILPRKRGSGRGSAAVIWLLSQRLIPRSGCEVPPLLKPINRLPRTLREGRRDLERESLYCRELFFLSFCSALVNSLFLLEILQERDRERVKACNPRCDNLKQGLI